MVRIVVQLDQESLLSEQPPPSSGPRTLADTLLSRSNSVVMKSRLQELAPAALGAGLLESMRVYLPRTPVDPSSLAWLGTPGVLGGEVLSGEPRLYGRFDFCEGNMAAGLFMATTGRIRIVFPFTEHATILEGEVSLTDEAGRTQSLKPGDTYFIRQDQVILWDVKGPHVIKSFFNTKAR